MARRGSKNKASRGGKPQRTDLMAQRVQTAPGQQYGERAAQERAQQAVPVAQLPPMPQPGAAGAFNRPSERPQEPVTAGLSSGPGPGPEVLSAGLSLNDPMLKLRRIYQLYPNEDLRRLIELWENRA